MKLIQILFIFAAVGGDLKIKIKLWTEKVTFENFTVSFQQSIRCFSCTNCGPTSEWTRRDCRSGEDDDENVGPPTPPTSPLGFSAKNVSIDGLFPIAPMNNTNITNTGTTAIVENTNAQFSCFTAILNGKNFEISSNSELIIFSL